MEATAVRTTEYEISDADAIEQFLVDAYGTSMRIRGGNDRHLLRHRRTDAGALAVEAAYQSADLEFSVEPLNKIVVTRTSTSRLERAGDGADRRYGVGELFVMSRPRRAADRDGRGVSAGRSGPPGGCGRAAGPDV